MKTFIHFFRVLGGLDRPLTQVTRNELSAMLKYTQAAEKVVEIGCFEGATTVAFAGATRGQVYSIDTFQPGRLGVCYGYLVARTEIMRKGIHNVHLIKASSHEAAKRFGYEIDFLFVDGDHSLEGVERDWSDWFPKVKVGGYIAMHDCRICTCSSVELGSMQFYQERLLGLEGLDELECVDSLAIFRKLR
jgi:predicted O-methyltransferase YrrM